MSSDANSIEETKKILEGPNAEAIAAVQKEIRENLLHRILAMPGARRTGPNKVGFDCPVSPSAQYIRVAKDEGRRA